MWRERLERVLRDEGGEDEDCVNGNGKGDGKGDGHGKVKITKVLLTHWHGDHVGGVDDVRDLVGGGENREGEGEEEVELEVWKGSLGGEGEDDSDSDSSEKKDNDKNNKTTKNRRIHTIKPGQTFSVPGAHLTAIFTPGHTSDHMSFFLREENALFTGDNVLGHGTAVFENLSEYMESLERMQGVFVGHSHDDDDGKRKRKGTQRAYPSHGEVVEDGPGKIREYIAHRRQREMEVLEVLGRRKGEAAAKEEGIPGGDGWWESWDMVKVVYAAYPEEYWGPAEGSLKQVLKKLERDGKVRQMKGRDGENGKWALIEKSAL